MLSCSPGDVVGDFVEWFLASGNWDDLRKLLW